MSKEVMKCKEAFNGKALREPPLGKDDRISNIQNFNMKLAIALLCFMIVVSAKKETPVTLCGRQLANARLLVCFGEFVDKRTSPESIFAALADGDKWLDGYMWSGRRGALSADWSRYKRDGLADECCLKPCTTDVILNYC
ncbi:bombyxin G-1 [Zerene cesonia]|uniref:bombyxin G-1 n=1 Tax=Zerene cesonia TaxID=33412 RepID=UPI0018E571AA|nr:bombyxin G-1 [Zerene cesonia]